MRCKINSVPALWATVKPRRADTGSISHCTSQQFFLAHAHCGACLQPLLFLACFMAEQSRRSRAENRNGQMKKVNSNFLGGRFLFSIACSLPLHLRLSLAYFSLASHFVYLQGA